MTTSKVLCVEDDLIHQEVIGAMARSLVPQPEIRWATSAGQAFQILLEAKTKRKADPFDLILTDIFLEGRLTGIDLMNVCRKIYPQMPVVLMSALPFEKFTDFGAVEPGSICYLNKPLNPVLFQRAMALGHQSA